MLKYSYAVFICPGILPLLNPCGYPNTSSSATTSIDVLNQMPTTSRLHNSKFAQRLPLESMTIQDSNGCLILRHVLYTNATIGAMKLLMERNPDSLLEAYHQRSFHLHIACEFCASNTMQFLLELDNSSLNHCDLKINSHLHDAYRGCNYVLVKYLLEWRKTVSELNGVG